MTIFLIELQYLFSFSNLWAVNFIKLLWVNFWWEWVLIHSFFFYLLYRFFNEINYYKLAILIMYFLILVCCVLSFLQFELFAAFLFLSEFLIFIFFYSCFLLLNYTNKINFFFTPANIFIFLVVGVILYILFRLDFLFLFELNDLYLLSYNLFKIYNNFCLNDLIFFFHMFYIYLFMLYYLVGFILFILTLMILQFIFVLIYINFSKTYVRRSHFFLKDNFILKNQTINFWNKFFNK